MKTLSATLAFTLATLATIAQAQNGLPTNGGEYHPMYSTPGDRVFVPVPASCWPEHHASTAAESWARGQAALIEAQAYSEYWSAQAGIFATETQAGQLYVKEQARKNYLAMRKQYEEEQKLKCAAQRSQNLLSRPTHTSPAIQVFDPATDTILWPSALKNETFAPYRKTIESAFQKSGWEPRPEVPPAVDKMLVQLRDNISTIAAKDYIAAKKFLIQIRFTTSKDVLFTHIAPNTNATNLE